MAKKSITARLKDLGIDSSRTEVIKIRPSDVTVETGTHPLADPVRDKWPEDKELTESLKTLQINPLILWEDGVDKAGKARLVCVAGRQRLKSGLSLEADDPKFKLRALIIDVDVETARQVMLDENLKRRAETPASIAAKAQNMELSGMKKSEIAKRLGMNTAHLDNIMTFNKAHPSIKDLVEEGGMALNAVLELAGVPFAEQAAIAQVAVATAGGKQVRKDDVAAAVEATKEATPEATPEQITDAAKAKKDEKKAAKEAPKVVKPEDAPKSQAPASSGSAAKIQATPKVGDPVPASLAGRSGLSVIQITRWLNELEAPYNQEDETATIMAWVLRGVLGTDFKESEIPDAIADLWFEQS